MEKAIKFLKEIKGKLIIIGSIIAIIITSLTVVINNIEEIPTLINETSVQDSTKVDIK